ncbi:MAG: hypothetical protein ACQSGP_25185 [Frankia sp.]
MRNVSVQTSVFPAAGTWAETKVLSDGLPYLEIVGTGLRLTIQTIDAADPDYLAFARRLRDAAEQLVQIYEGTFPTAAGDEANPAA